MSLLTEIRNDLLDEEVSISAVLRKAKVLSVELGDSKFKDWVDNERNGYGPDQKLPDYRVIGVQSVGHISAPFGQQAKNISLPTSHLDESVAKGVSTVQFTSPIATIEAQCEGDEDVGNLKQKWPAELIQYYNSVTDLNGNLIGARKIIPIHAVKGIIESVKDRLLDFVVELEQRHPELAENEESDVSSEEINNITNQHIYGDVASIATSATGDISQKVVQKGDISSEEDLYDFFRDKGIDEEDIERLSKALSEDGDIKPSNYGENVRQWMASMIQKAQKGVWNVSTSVATKLITQGLDQYASQLISGSP